MTPFISFCKNINIYPVTGSVSSKRLAIIPMKRNCVKATKKPNFIKNDKKVTKIKKVTTL